MKKIMVLAIIAIFAMQANVFAQEAEGGKKAKGMAVGIEAGYLWELIQDDLSENSYPNGDAITTAPDTWNVGINISKSKGKSVDGGAITPITSVTSIGYTFIENGWGMYFSSDVHYNKKMGKKGTNYFYTGAGNGLNFAIYDKSGAMYENRYDVSWQALRVPVGFSFLIKNKTELFFEGVFYMGARFTDGMGDDNWFDKNGNEQYDLQTVFDLGFEVKGGVRFWF